MKPTMIPVVANSTQRTVPVNGRGERRELTLTSQQQYNVPARGTGGVLTSSVEIPSNLLWKENTNNVTSRTDSKKRHHKEQDEKEYNGGFDMNRNNELLDGEISHAIKVLKSPVDFLRSAVLFSVVRRRQRGGNDLSSTSSDTEEEMPLSTLVSNNCKDVNNRKGEYKRQCIIAVKQLVEVVGRGGEGEGVEVVCESLFKVLKSGGKSDDDDDDDKVNLVF